ncbi:MAG: metallopeptidase family protein [Parcubacteria group bacterium]
MPQEDFEKLIGEAILNLPEEIRQKMKNIAIIVDHSPTEEQLGKVGTKQGDFLLGLYEGIPQNAWGKGFGGNLPDKITIFEESIKEFAKTSEDIKKLTKNVVWHEIAHHFGFKEKEVRKLEKRWNLK